MAAGPTSGAARLPLLAAGSQGVVLRRRRRRLADLLQGHRPLLRPRRGIRRRLRDAGEATEVLPTASSSRRWGSPARNGSALTASRRSSVACHAGPHRQSHRSRINGRAPCHYCGPCEHGCVTHSYFKLAWTTMADAAKTGKCTLITGRDGLQGDHGPAPRIARRASPTSIAPRAGAEIYGRVVALCAQTQESVRILFNSAITQDPGGLANSSGMLGKYLMTHLSDSGGVGRVAGSDGKPEPDGDANRPWRARSCASATCRGRATTKGFLRGYGIGRVGERRPHLQRAGLWRGVQRGGRRTAAGDGGSCRATASACPTKTTTASSTRTSSTPSASRWSGCASRRARTS